MQLKDGCRAGEQKKRGTVLCIDNHASSNYTCFLLVRNGYQVDCATFLCDALEMLQASVYDLCLINDELACQADKQLLKEVREAMGATPALFYSTIIYPFNPRLADQSGNTPDTPVAVTEVPIAVYRKLSQAPRFAPCGAAVSARMARESRSVQSETILRSTLETI